MKRRTFVYLMTALVTGSALVSPYEVEMIAGSNYGIPHEIPAHRLRPQAFHKEEKTVFVLGEMHVPDWNYSVETIHTLSQHHGVDLVGLEGIEGNVTGEMRARMLADKEFRLEMIDQDRDFLGGYIVEDGVKLLPNDEHPFFYSPGAVHVPRLPAVDLFGYEDMAQYIAAWRARTPLGIELAITSLRSNYSRQNLPDELRERRKQIIFGAQNTRNHLVEELITENPFFNENQVHNRSGELNQRSRTAVTNLTEKMENDDYRSAVLVMGLSHIPVVKDTLEEYGFKEGRFFRMTTD